MNPSHRAYCDVALAMHQRRNMSVAISLGLVGSTQPKSAPRYRVIPVSGEFFHIVDDELPALRIELTGMVTASNLKMFEDSALAVIDSVKTTLSTDQDFADAKKAGKWCGDVEEAVAVAKKQALSQTQSIDELFSSLDRISAHARETRLKVDKLVKAQELLVKTTIKQKAELALADHIAAINKTLGKVTLPHIISDFAGAMKSKRTIASLQDAVDTELARAKIDASQAADSIRLNLTSLAELAVDHAFLFSDVQQLVAGVTLAKAAA